jgi:16S rRNA processing protein RimM
LKHSKPRPDFEASTTAKAAVTVGAGDHQILLGVVTKPHGVRGAVRVKVFNNDTEMLGAGQVVRVSPPEASLSEYLECSIESSQRGAGVWVLKLAGVDEIEQADELRGAQLWVDRSELPAPADNEFYFVEAPLMTVVSESGELIAPVLRAESYPSTDVVVCLMDGQEVEWSLAAGVFSAFDRASRTLTIDTEFLAAFREQLAAEREELAAKARAKAKRDV